MLKSLSLKDNRVAADVINLVLGVTLVLSPWFLGYAAETSAAWNAWVAGAAVTLIAAGALVAFHRAEEWANLVLGLWTLIAPWVLGFAAATAAAAVHIIVGAMVAVLAAAGLWFAHNRPMSTA